MTFGAITQQKRIKKRTTAPKKTKASASKTTKRKTPVRSAATPATNVRAWYMKTYPTDDLGTMINPKLTFGQVRTALNNRKDIYNVIGVGDSVVRERVFDKLAKVYKVDYGVVLDTWDRERTIPQLKRRK